MKFLYVRTETPKTSIPWQRMPLDDRMEIVSECCADSGVKVIDAGTDGQIIVRLLSDLPASQRGTLLLNIEERLKREIDGALTVWLEYQDDKNALRNLRGIEIKS